jgi:hypothetical protein
LGGFYAEAHHAATFNIDAAVRNSSENAIRVGSTGNASPDIQTSWYRDISVKYNRDAIHSLAEQARSVRGLENARYQGQERLVPSDQLTEASGLADAKIAKEAILRPNVAERSVLQIEYKKGAKPLIALRASWTRYKKTALS